MFVLQTSRGGQSDRGPCAGPAPWRAPPFECAPCKRKFSWELKALSHVTKNHSGETFKEVIVKKPEVNILASGARPLSEDEAKSHLHDQIAKKMLKFPLKRKAERDQTEGQPPIAAKSRPETSTKAEASATLQQKGPEVEPIVLPTAPQADRALPAALKAPLPHSQRSLYLFHQPRFWCPSHLTFRTLLCATHQPKTPCCWRPCV